MGYKMNIGNELAQIKKCKTVEEAIIFLEDHNLKFDHCYSGNEYGFVRDNISHPLTYLVANY